MELHGATGKGIEERDERSRLSTAVGSSSRALDFLFTCGVEADFCEGWEERKGGRGGNRRQLAFHGPPPWKEKMKP